MCVRLGVFECVSGVSIVVVVAGPNPILKSHFKTSLDPNPSPYLDFMIKYIYRNPVIP